ncbi:predicted protein [Histoplasma capsulatum var. duboisii H88]|uniref:Predicted protein n=2 Tax=Ajellomyces capsulatus TaxID=5037 RepID=F0U721_AJEC8|nr:predicted protein [Histoplasma capsulatum H143]EGC40703.1 predicted protein [Histoplasma capsulatum var. duboisii H88]
MNSRRLANATTSTSSGVNNIISTAGDNLGGSPPHSTVLDPWWECHWGSRTLAIAMKLTTASDTIPFWSYMNCLDFITGILMASEPRRWSPKHVMAIRPRGASSPRTRLSV